MAPASNSFGIRSLLPPPPGGVAAAVSLPATDRQTTSSLTHAAGKSAMDTILVESRGYDTCLHLLFSHVLHFKEVLFLVQSWYCYDALVNGCLHLSITDILTAFERRVDAQWRHFGTFLRIEPTLMNTISRDSGGHTTDCMLDLVTKWIDHHEDTGDLPRTWKTVVDAVRYTPGCEQLAKELAVGHGVTLSQW